MYDLHSLITMSVVKPPRPCSKCGGIVRFKNGSCKPCDMARIKAYRATLPKKVKISVAERVIRNAEKSKARHKKWCAANPEKVKTNRSSWAKANPEKVRASFLAWHAANPEASRIYCQNRKDKRIGNGGVLSHGLSAKLFILQKGKCACCETPLGDKYHLDHIMPLALGGANTDDNIQLLRASCNYQKNAKHPIDFMQSKGFLL